MLLFWSQHRRANMTKAGVAIVRMPTMISISWPIFLSGEGSVFPSPTTRQPTAGRVPLLGLQQRLGTAGLALSSRSLWHLWHVALIQQPEHGGLSVGDEASRAHDLAMPQSRWNPVVCHGGGPIFLGYALPSMMARTALCASMNACLIFGSVSAPAFCFSHALMCRNLSCDRSISSAASRTFAASGSSGV